MKNFSVRFGFGFRNLKPEKPQPVGGYYKYKKKCLFLTLASTGLQSSFSLILLASTGLQSSFSLILSHSLTIHISHFHVHAQICNCNKIKLIHHLHPQPATSLSHTRVPDLKSYDTHHTDTLNLQSSNFRSSKPVRQSPSSLTPDLESCHNSHQV